MDLEKDRPVSPEELDDVIQSLATEEQLYSIAVFDILGFSNYVNSNTTDQVLKLYEALVTILNKRKTIDIGILENTSGVPVPDSGDWKVNHFVAQANGYSHVVHFSDTFILYMHYRLTAFPFHLRTQYYEGNPLLFNDKFEPDDCIFNHAMYLAFLQTCMEFFCEAISIGIPLRGCVSTGPAVMNHVKNVYVGSALVDAAKGEPVLNSIGLLFGSSFRKFHPVYSSFFIPYNANRKTEKNDKASIMALDWPRYWREKEPYCTMNLEEKIMDMNNDPAHSSYYENAVDFVRFSETHHDWASEIETENVTNIDEYYDAVKKWFGDKYHSERK